MGFDKGYLRDLFSQTETYLGYLKGNELAYDYLWQTVYYFGNQGTTPGPSTYTVDLNHYPSTYEFPCPDSFYKVRPDMTSFTVAYDPDSVPSGTDPFERLAREIRQHTDQAWQGGPSWASGLGDYLYSLCGQFVEPDVQSLAGTVRAMQHDVVSSLEISARDDWALIGALLTEWHGDSAYAFKTFYDNYNDTLTQFALFGAYVTAGFAAATKIINGTQQGVTKYAESLRDAARSQAEQWRNGYPPRDTPELPAWVVKVGEVAADAYELLDHVPVVSTGKGYIDKAVSITESVNKIANDLGIDGDISLLPHEERPFKAVTADELYADGTDTLNTDYHQAYDTAMDQLYSGSGPTDPDHANDVPFSGQAVESLLQSLKDRYDWGLPEVPPDSLYEPGDRY